MTRVVCPVLVAQPGTSSKGNNIARSADVGGEPVEGEDEGEEDGSNSDADVDNLLAAAAAQVI